MGAEGPDRQCQAAAGPPSPTGAPSLSVLQGGRAGCRHQPQDQLTRACSPAPAGPSLLRSTSRKPPSPARATDGLPGISPPSGLPGATSRQRTCPLLLVPAGVGPSSALETAAVGPRTCYHVATEPFLLPTMFNSPIKAPDPSSSSSAPSLRGGGDHTGQRPDPPPPSAPMSCHPGEMVREKTC